MDSSLYGYHDQSLAGSTESTSDLPKVSLHQGDGGWEPEMGPEQQAFYWDSSPYCLAHGERATGKTTIGIDKFIRHAYEHTGALVMVVTIIKAGARGGGIWEQLNSLDTDHRGEPWGNLAKWKKHVGLQYTDEYGDDSKNKWVDIRTKDGGSSSILLLSMPVGAHIKDRIKDFKPSYFHFEELTNTHDRDYFVKVVQQLGRRASVPSKAQQYVATCNPPDDGEGHWVFKTFFLHKALNPRGGAEPAYDPKMRSPYDGKPGWNRNFGVHHLPSQSNKWMEDMESYQAKILEECRDDPTAYDRMVLGRWIAKVAGNSVFAFYYEPSIHLMGELDKSGLMPIKGYNIIIGYDPGDANNSRTLLQRVPCNNRWIWRVIDCLTNLNEHTSYHEIIKSTYDRMLFWCKRVDFAFDFEHIGDKAAFTHYNPQGSYDYQVFEKISRELNQEDKYRQLGPILMRAPEKGEGSVGERVRCIKDLLSAERLLVSALAPDVDNMFKNLMKAKDRHGNEDDNKPLKTRKGHIHVFDSTSYPIYYYEQLPFDNLDTGGGVEDLECGTFS